MQHRPATTQIPTQQHIKQLHLKEILLLALGSDGISRAQLRQSLGLSFPSVSALVEELLTAGILTEDGTLEAAPRGRPRSLLRVNPGAFVVPVAVMTPEGYRCSVFNCCGNILQQCCLPYPESLPEKSRPDMPWFSAPLQPWLTQLQQQYPIARLVMVVSGNFNEAGALSSTVLKFTTPDDFLKQLQQQLVFPVELYNNADCFAYGEKYCQSLPEDFIFLIVSRGVGAGIIRHGEVFSGSFLRAGEIGHMTIDCNGRPCSCGNRGCLERYVNLECIVQEASALLKKTMTFSQVCQAYRQDDPLVTALLQEKARLLAVGISNMLAMQPVTHIVVGGGIEQLGRPFLDALQQAIGSTGLRKYMDRVTVSYTRNTRDGDALGAFRNFLDHSFCIEDILSTGQQRNPISGA